MLIAICMLMAIGMHADLRNQQMELIAHNECRLEKHARFIIVDARATHASAHRFCAPPRSTPRTLAAGSTYLKLKKIFCGRFGSGGKRLPARVSAILWVAESSSFKRAQVSGSR